MVPGGLNVALEPKIGGGAEEQFHFNAFAFSAIFIRNNLRMAS